MLFNTILFVTFEYDIYKYLLNINFIRKIMKKIEYLKGNAITPIVKDEEVSVICHCCNTIGKWGKGFVVALGAHYPESRKAYYSYLKDVGYDNALGKCCLVSVGKNLAVANVFGQKRIYPTWDGKIPLDYEALENGLTSCRNIMEAMKQPFTIHMPRIGCGLAGGKWEIVEGIINKVFGERDIQVYVYDLN